MSDSTSGSKQLPIYEHQHELIECVRNNRVVVIEGATGTGKTTQLQKEWT
jgi:HrpA-like RNA helicase